MDYVQVNDRNTCVILAQYCITRLPDDGSSVIRNMSEHFKYFIILIAYKNYIFEGKLDNKLFIEETTVVVAL